MQLKSSKAVELALKARSSLDDTLSEVGIQASGEKASRTLASAWAGARAAIQVDQDSPFITCSRLHAC